MKTELKAKFLQHLIQRKQDDKGFTLIELLVVIIIIGVLSAIALPNFLNQTAKAKQSEAKQNVGVINRTQTAYRTENNSFASTFDALAIGSLTGSTAETSTTNYVYKLATSGKDTATILVTAQDTSLKGYSGGSFMNTSTGQSVVSSIICEAKKPTDTPTVPTSAASCTGEQEKLGG